MLINLPANWPADILDEYMVGVQKDCAMKNRINSLDENDAQFSDSEWEEESYFIASSASAPSRSSQTPMVIDRCTFGGDVIDSDDDAFSSDDEFGEAAIVENQRMRRELVLGRPSGAILDMTSHQLARHQESYMKQLDDADAERAERKGAELPPIVRRSSTDPTQKLEFATSDGEDYVAELRHRSWKEIFETERSLALVQLVTLAQALFRREREIKAFQNYSTMRRLELSMRVVFGIKIARER